MPVVPRPSRAVTLGAVLLLAAGLAPLAATAATPSSVGPQASIAPAATTSATLGARDIRGVNWADGRDNFVCGNLTPSGLWSTDSYAAVHSKAEAIYAGFERLIGPNTVRLPVNVDTVAGSWWPNYTAAIDAATERGWNVILSEWDECNSKDGKLDPGWDAMWDRVVAKYAGNDRVLFEIMNEPHGYSTSAWLDVAASWIARYPTLPRGRIVVSGPGLNNDAYSAGRDHRFDGTLLSIHHYAFWQGPLSYDQWRAQTRQKVAEFASRAVFTEVGTKMTTGLDFSDASSTVNEIQYLRGITDEFAALGVGSVYWPGLRLGDWYSLTTITGDAAGGSGSSIAMAVTNPSGIARVRIGWRVGATPSPTTSSPTPSTTSPTPSTTSPTTSPTPTGTAFTLVGLKSKKCVEVPGGVSTDGTRVALGVCKPGQLWTTTAAGEVRTLGKCLDVIGQSTTPGAEVALYTCNGGANQRWTFADDGSVVGVQSGLCLDTVGGAKKVGTRVVLATCTGAKRQRWVRK